MNRYRPGLRMAREIAATGGLVGLCCNWSGKTYSVPWWTEREQSGGPINEQATHVVDLCRYIGGEIRDVCVQASTTGTRLAAALTLENGALATLFYTCEAREKCISLEVITNAGHVCFSGWDFTPHTNTVNGRLPLDELSPFIAETRAFLSAVESGDTSGISSDFVDAHRTQVLVDRIRRQALGANLTSVPS
jgi:predicted dehydrogenase